MNTNRIAAKPYNTNDSLYIKLIPYLKLLYFSINVQLITVLSVTNRDHFLQWYLLNSQSDSATAK